MIRVETVGDLFDVALLLPTQPLPGGRPDRGRRQLHRPGRAGHERAAREGLQLTRLDDSGSRPPPTRSSGAARGAADDRVVDAVVPSCSCRRCSAEPAPRPPPRRAHAAATSGKPVLSTFLGFEGVPAELAADGEDAPPRGSVPSYPSPERAVRALARRCATRPWRRRAARRGAGAARRRPRGGRAGRRRRPGGRPAGRDLDRGRGAAAARPPRASRCRSMLPAERRRRRRADRPRRQSFGALVSFGMRGVATELLGDTAYATVPLTTADADRPDLAAARGAAADRLRRQERAPPRRAGRPRAAGVGARRGASGDHRVPLTGWPPRSARTCTEVTRAGGAADGPRPTAGRAGCAACERRQRDRRADVLARWTAGAGRRLPAMVAREREQRAEHRLGGRQS